MKDTKDGGKIAQQARKLLSGEESWAPGWREYGLGRGAVRGVDREEGEGGGS